MGFESGDVAACLSFGEPEVCNRAAIANPGHPKLWFLLGPPCRAQLEGSCRRYYETSRRSGEAHAAETAMMLGCEAGDDYLCEKYLEKARITENHAQREWMIEHVRKSRASNASAPTPP